MDDEERALRALAIVGARVARGELGQQDLATLRAALGPFAAENLSLALDVPALPPGAPTGPGGGPGASLAVRGAGGALLGPPVAGTASHNGRSRAEAVRSARRATAVRIFEYWKTTTNRLGAKPLRKRIAAVESRLREGYDEDDIRAAIDGCVGSDFHAGDNPGGTRHDDLSLICRDGTNVERFASYAGHEPNPEQSTDADALRGRYEHQLRAAIALAMKEKDRERYEKLNEQLRILLRKDEEGTRAGGR